jgi:hypothetical protein
MTLSIQDEEILKLAPAEWELMPARIPGGAN